MKTTSHFIGLQMKSELFSDIFVKVYEYLKENNIWDALQIQNPLSPHITLYYLHKDVSDKEKENIQHDISLLNISDDIFLKEINYFFKDEKRYILYFTPSTNLELHNYRDILHKKYNREDIEENSFEFTPHITLLRIINVAVFEAHRNNIENIISQELKKLTNINVSAKDIWLYAVNSNFREEIQIKL